MRYSLTCDQAFFSHSRSTPQKERLISGYDILSVQTVDVSEISWYLFPIQTRPYSVRLGVWPMRNASRTRRLVTNSFFWTLDYGLCNGSLTAICRIPSDAGNHSRLCEIKRHKDNSTVYTVYRTRNPTSAMEKVGQNWKNCHESCCGTRINSRKDSKPRGSLDRLYERLWPTFSTAVG